MGRITALKLSLGLAGRPAIIVELHHIGVHGFCQEWTGRDGPPGSVKLEVLAVALVKDGGPDSVHLFHGGAVDEANDTVKKEDKVEGSLSAKVQKM